MPTRRARSVICLAFVGLLTVDTSVQPPQASTKRMTAASSLPTAGAMPPLYVVRSGAHSGSDWCSHLLATAGWSTFFQFGGLCDGLPLSGHPTAPAPQVARALLEALARGCGCGAGQVFSCNAAFQPGCAEKVPLCHSIGCTAACPAGGAAAVVGAPLDPPLRSLQPCEFKAGLAPIPLGSVSAPVSPLSGHYLGVQRGGVPPFLGCVTSPIPVCGPGPVSPCDMILLLTRCDCFLDTSLIKALKRTTSVQ